MVHVREIKQWTPRLAKKVIAILNFAVAVFWYLQHAAAIHALATNQVRVFTCDNCQRSVVLKPVINSMFTDTRTERETSLKFFGRYNSNQDYSSTCRRGGSYLPGALPIDPVRKSVSIRIMSL